MVGTNDYFLLLSAYFGDHFHLLCHRLLHVRYERHYVSFNGMLRSENQPVYPVKSNYHCMDMLIDPLCLHRRSYMSASFFLLNLLITGSGKEILRCHDLYSNLSFFFGNKFDNTGAQMLDHIYYMTLKLFLNMVIAVFFGVKAIRFCYRYPTIFRAAL